MVQGIGLCLYPKLILPFGKRTVIETVVNNAIQSEADEVLVVLGSGAEKIAEKIKHFPQAFGKGLSKQDNPDEKEY